MTVPYDLAVFVASRRRSRSERDKTDLGCTSWDASSVRIIRGSLMFAVTAKENYETKAGLGKARRLHHSVTLLEVCRCRQRSKFVVHVVDVRSAGSQVGIDKQPDQTISTGSLPARFCILLINAFVRSIKSSSRSADPKATPGHLIVGGGCDV